MSPKKSRKQGGAREKDGTQIAFFTEPHPGRRRAGPLDDETHTHTHTHTHFRVDVGKSGKHAEKKGWPDGRQACNGVKTKNELRQARRTCSPLQQPAARTGASCRAAILGPTQRMLGRPGRKHENGRPTRKMTITNKNARDDRASVLRKVENNDARRKKKAPR